MVVVVVLARKRREVATMSVSCLGLTIPDSLERDAHHSVEKESKNGRGKKREVAMMSISCLGLTIPNSLERDAHQSV